MSKNVCYRIERQGGGNCSDTNMARQSAVYQDVSLVGGMDCAQNTGTIKPRWAP